MPAVLDESFSVRRLSPEGQHFFGGYYDVPLAHPDGRRVLAHEVGFIDRLPTATDIAALGWLDLGSENPQFHPWAETRGWNFQQGAFLQWVGGSQSRVFWNNFISDGPAYGELFNPETGEKSRVDRPAANLSRDGRWGLSLSFERLFDFRPGYGYANRPDPFAQESFPQNEGIFLIDLEAGTSRLILSLSQMRDLMTDVVPGPVGKLTVNHMTFNPSGTRFLGLVRTSISVDGMKHWGTWAFTAKSDGSDVRTLLPFGKISHYFWADDQELLIWSDGPQGMQLYRVPVEAGESEITPVDPAFFLRDGHMSLSPDGRYLLYDSYPDENREQSLFLYEWKEGAGVLVGKFPTMEFPTGEIRCDLHPRWNPDSRGFTFDSTHEGYRAVYACDISEFNRRA